MYGALPLFKFCKTYINYWLKHQISLRAAALTYTFILGMIPALAVCLSAFSLFFDINRYAADFKFFLLKQLAAGSGLAVTKYLDNFLSHVRFKAIGYIGFAALLITSLLLLSSIEDAINRIWSIKKRKAIWKRFIIYNLILFLGPVTVSLSVASTAIVTNFFPAMILKANIGAVLISTLFLTLTYKIFPNKKVEWLPVITSGLIVAIISELAKWGYAIYTAKALFYNKVYGGLAVLPLFLLWIYLNWTIFLGGALLSFMLQHKKSLRL